MKTKTGMTLAILVALLFSGALMLQPKTSVADTSCGDITVAEMTWSSAAFLGHLDKYMLETVYGCNVQMIQGGTVGLATSLAEKSEPDVASELWASTVQGIVDDMLARGTAVVANNEPISGGASENWYVLPKTLEAYPELKTVEDVLNNPEIFGGKVYVCPVGWGCATTTVKILEAYGAEEKGWEIVDPGSGVGLDGSIAKAGNSDDHWFGFYWEPAGMVGKYDLQPIPTGKGFAGTDHWVNCIQKEDCDSPQITDFSVPTLYKMVSSDMSQNGDVMQYLGTRSIDINLFNSLIVKMDEQQETAEESVESFLKAYPDVWTKWLDQDGIDAVNATLN